MPLSAARRWLKFLLCGCWAARLLECAGLPLLRRTRGLEFLQSCGECFGAPLPLAVACLFALGGLAARTRDAPAGTRADDAVAEGPRPAVAIALPVHLRGRGRWEEAQMTEVAQGHAACVCCGSSRARVGALPMRCRLKGGAAPCRCAEGAPLAARLVRLLTACRAAAHSAVALRRATALEVTVEAAALVAALLDACSAACGAAAVTA
ncbi:hypothetical protein ERJ75_000586600 [Trypanosoma vivax]|nr:hypothetical protein ERJ75_000586600 [Trypanosoma vivax]